MNIGGNVQAVLQVKDNHTKNVIGECVPAWVDCLCDYSKLVSVVGEEITSENARMVIGGNDYEILLVDNPLQMNRQLEFYLKYVGGGLGVS